MKSWAMEKPRMLKESGDKDEAMRDNWTRLKEEPGIVALESCVV